MRETVKIIKGYSITRKKGEHKMKKEIVGEKATYVVEEINDIGDFKITIYGHKSYKNGQSWVVGNFDYMSSINRIEAGKKMLLELMI